MLSITGDGRSPPAGGCLAMRTPTGDLTAISGARQALGDPGFLQTPLPMQWDTSVDLGSVTKIVATTTALMMLVDLRIAKLEDPIRRFVPQASVDATVADLLLHRSGLWEWWPFYVTADTRADVIDAACRLPPRYLPGTRHYSDLGFILLGAVVEHATSLDLDVAIGQLVLEPFNLTATQFARPSAQDNTAATSRGDWIERRMIDTGDPYPVTAHSEQFNRWREHVLVGEVNDGNAFHGCRGVSGHAGLFSTIPDLLDYGTMLLASLDGDGPLRRTTIQQFTRNARDANQALGFLTWRTTMPGCSSIVFGHPGFPGVTLGVIPRHRTVVALALHRLQVTGEPIKIEPAWDLALHAAHKIVHETAHG